MNPREWDIRREGRRWTREESQHWLYHAPNKIEFVGGIFAGERERLLVLGMLLENLGIDKVVRFGNLADWKAAIAELESEPPHQSAITSDRALHIARLDAEKAYGDLTPYRVSLVLEDDGWHVDYALKNPLWNGGAPHYLIDLIGGTILWKRYDQ